MSLRVAVLISGAGTNLQALLDTVHGRHGIDIVAVASSTSTAGGLVRAERAGVETAVFPIAEHRDRAARDRASWCSPASWSSSIRSSSGA